MDFINVIINKDMLIMVGVVVFIAFASFMFDAVGSINIGLDGHFIVGVFGFTLSGFLLKDTELQLMFVIMIQLFVSWVFVIASMLLFAVCTFNFKLNPIIVGVAINTLIIALVTLLIYIIKPTGALAFLQGTDYHSLREDVSWLYLQTSSFDIFLPFLLIFPTAYSICYFLWKTRPGLRIRAIQKNPKIFQDLGLSRNYYRYLIVLFASVMMTFACFFYAEYKPIFSGKFTGLGFIGLLITILANKRVAMMIFYAVLFGVIQNGLFNLSDYLSSLENVPENIKPWLNSTFTLEVFQGFNYVIPLLFLIVWKINLKFQKRSVQAPS